MAQNFYADHANHPLDGIEEIVINAVEADITLLNAGTNQISWEANWRDAVGQPEIIREGKRLIVRFNERNIYVNFFGITIGKSRDGTWRGSLESAKITLPEGFPLLSVNLVSGDVIFDNLNLERSCRIDTMSGNVRGTNMRVKEAKITTKSGDISLRGIIGDSLTLDSFSGEIEVKDHSCRRMHLKSKSGDIQVSKALADLKELNVDNISGDIEIEQAPAMAKVNTISGNIRFSSREKKGIDWHFRSVSGDIVLDTADIHSHLYFSSISGEIHFQNVRPGYNAKNEYLIGDGQDGKITLQTVSGDARMRVTETEPHQPAKEPPTTKVEGSEESRETDFDRKEYAKRFVQPDENVLKVVQMNRQGILSREEAVDLLRSMGYKDEEIALFLGKGDLPEGE